MTAREENLLMSREHIRKGTVIDELLKACVVDKTINLSELLVGDRNAIMIAIRCFGIGEDYSARVECPECQSKTDFVFDLTQLDTKDFQPISQIAPFQNAFSFVLPFTKHEVVFKLLTGGDERKILDLMEQRKKKNLPDEMITTRLLYSILSINGKEERAFIANYINNMPARDARALRKFMDENEPSIDMSQTFKCSNCGYEEVMQIPMGPEFLWPK
jgi:rubredoxin